MELGTRQELLEKPISKADHLRMLQDLNGNVCEVVTGVSLGGLRFIRLSGVDVDGGFVASVPCAYCAGVCDEVSGFWCVGRPGIDRRREMDERTLVYFADSPVEILKAYVENGEGYDRAGGFAVQVRFDLHSDLLFTAYALHCVTAPPTTPGFGEHSRSQNRWGLQQRRWVSWDVLFSLSR